MNAYLTVPVLQNACTCVCMWCFVALNLSYIFAISV